MSDDNGIRRAALGELCTITVGVALSRARKLPDGSRGQSYGILTQRAVTCDGILPEETTLETLSPVRDGLITREGDIVVKTTTPYDATYIDREHAGFVVPSFAVILRARGSAAIDMRYLAAVLGMHETREDLQRLSSGSRLLMLKKADLARLSVPVADAATQRTIALLHERTIAYKDACRQAMRTCDMLLDGQVDRLVFLSKKPQLETGAHA